MLRRLVALALLCGCSSSVRKCVDQTVLLMVTLVGHSADADNLEVTMTISGKSAVTTNVMHTPGQATGNLQIEFPTGYPKNGGLTVEIKATAGGVVLGMVTVLVPLDESCKAVPVTVTDLPDLAGLDFSPVPDTATPEMDAGDLGGGDFAVIHDLTPAPIPDMTQPPPDLIGLDLAGCVPVAENCFNGTDDDCDGLVDCVDPDCYSGVAPKAVCVPVPSSFTLGVTVGNGSCPGTWPTPLSLYADMNATCTPGSCSCISLGSPKCQLTLYNYGPDSTCTTPVSPILTGFADDTCYDLSIPGGGAYHAISAPTWVGDCGSPNGTAGQQASFATTETFCSGGAMGGGCGANYVCVPTASSHCVVTAGVDQTCPSGYTPRASTYYTGADATTLSCGCTCPVNAPGSCSGTPSGTIYTAAMCGGTPFVAGLNCNNTDVSFLPSGRINGLTAGAPTCGVGTSESGQVTLMGPHTICCVP